MAPHMRPRPSAIDQLPEECDAIVAWAAQELAQSGRTQTDIYAEFRTKLIALQGELGLGFDIPAFSSFNRHALKIGRLNARLKRSRVMAEAIVDQTAGGTDDNVTMAATLTLKTLILEMLENGGEDGFAPKEAKAMADAMRSLQLAENMSTTRRLKLEAEFAKKTETVLETLAKEPGISKESIARARKEFLGVRTKEESK
ncbi:DUF3486 family protein [Rhizobium mayense]|uniref:DUF3486 family protein n=1 Tax=Rhizobium mayense TaxID=1312184 RepID=A0ABT7JY39_9HYPH|nr:DUF3486 family protein [Rhizobium mayense]MDL2401266.1 DUF3486 family protein [Rhizobium mayense]